MKQEELIAERYELALARIKEIPDESICGENYRDYFMQMADFVLMMDQTYVLVEDGALRQMGMEELRDTINRSMPIFCRRITGKAMRTRIMQ